MYQSIQTASAIRQKPVLSTISNQRCEILPPFTTKDAAYYLLRQYGITPEGSQIMKNKLINRVMILRNITAPQALIIKQEMLARGGDAGLHSQVVTTEWNKFEEQNDIVLMGTMKQFLSVIEKLRGQQLNLDTIATLIDTALQQEEDVQLLYNKTFTLADP